MTAATLHHPSSPEFALDSLEATRLTGLDSPFLDLDIPVSRIGGFLGYEPTAHGGVRERAAAIAHVISQQHFGHDADCFTIAGHTARWVWTGGTAPSDIQLTSRRRLNSTPAIRCHRLVLGPGDVHYPAGIAVLSPERAFYELFAIDRTQALPGLTQLVAQGWVSGYALRAKAKPLNRAANNETEAARRRGLRSRANRYKRAAEYADQLEARLAPIEGACYESNAPSPD